MRVSKLSPVRFAFLAILSCSLILSLSVSLRLASVSANPVKPSSSAAAPPRNF